MLADRDLLTCQYIPGTIQGEGKFLGEPSVFVRTAQCNLHCQWCDTGYSWQARFRHDWRPIAFDELERLTPPHSERWGLVVTGGEPLLWQDHPSFEQLIAWGLRTFKRVTLETNGTIVPNRYLWDFETRPGASGAMEAEVWFSVSPKLANSGEPRRRRRNAEAVALFASLPHSYFKFVIESEDEDREILATYGEVPAQKIYLMPEGATPERLSVTSPVAIRMAMRNGWHLSLRAHIMLNLD